MALSPGTKLGPYEVLSRLGAGGMGEVYKAKDTRLDRTVAIKVLHEHLSSNAELRQRFEQEARAVSSLNHPHICTLFDIHLRQGSGGQVGHDVDIDFMVMEYIEGETLAERLARGPLSVDDAIAYGIEVADALHQAHRKGVVHRDVKPGNIMITKDGTKLLDFGLARIGGAVGRSFGEVGSGLATEAEPLTEKGTILGTFQYMAPEQLEGQEADARTDLFALGAVLYEMLTGRRAFEGKSQASLTAAIMTAEPPAPSSVRHVTPKRLDDAIARCLAKDPDARWQSAADLAWELGRRAEGQSEPAALQPSKLPWVVAAGAALLALAFLMLWQSSDAPATDVIVQTTIPPPENVRYGLGFALSPDGRHIVFTVADPDGEYLLAIRSLGELGVRTIEGTEGGRFPFWSPDGEAIGFFANGRLKKISTGGGPAESLAEAPAGGLISGTWSRQGTILYSSGARPILQITDVGGAPVHATVVDREAGEIGHYSPHFLPDGKHFVYRKYHGVGREGDTAEVFMASLGEPTVGRVLVRTSPTPLYNAVQFTEPGYVFTLDGDRTMYVQRFDLERLELAGARTPIVRKVADPEGYLSYSVASNGTLVYGSTDFGLDRGSPRWRDRTGAVVGEIELDTWTFGMSRDAQLVAINDGGLQLVNARGRGPARLGENLIEFEPVFSPDGRLVVYGRFGADGVELIQRSVQTEDERSLAMPAVDDFFPTDWSPDGSTVLLAATSSGLGGSFDIWAYSIEAESGETLLASEANERDGVFSPDGSLLAYASDESGRYNIYVRPISGSGVASRVSLTGGRWPEWRQDGNELFFMRPDGMIMAVAFGGDESFSEPTELFQVAVRSTDDYDLFDVAPDGERFLVLEQTNPQPPLILVQNWPALLDR